MPNVSIKTFRNRLRKDRQFSERFSDYVRDRRRAKWRSQAAIKEDPVVAELCKKQNLEVAAFIRLLDRVARSGAISPTNLERLAVALGLPNAIGLIEDFEKWVFVQPVADKEASEKCEGHFEVQQDGSYRLRIGAKIKTLEGATYQILSNLEAKSKRGDSSRAVDIRSNQKVFIKTLSLPDISSPKSIREQAAQLASFYRREKEMLMQLRGINGVARFLGYGIAILDFGDGSSCEVPFLSQEFIAGRNLADDMKEEFARGDKPSPVVWLRRVRELMTIIQDIHHLGIRHADLEASNVMVEDGSTRLILTDFGQSSIPLPQGISHNTDNSPGTVAPERKLLRSIPLEPAEDIYALGRIMYWLATGREYFEQHRPKDPYKRQVEIRTEVEVSNPALVAANPGVPYVISHALQVDRRHRASQVEDLIHTLDVFSNISTTSVSRSSAADPKQEAERLLEAIRRVKESNSLFAQAIRREMSQLLRRTREMLEHGRLEVSGTRDRIIATMLDFLATLEPGELYVTTATPTFWAKRNLGIRGRFWEANRLLAKNYVRIRRLIVVQDSDIRGGNDHNADRVQEFRNVMNEQKALMTELRDYLGKDSDQTVAGSGYYAGVFYARTPTEADEILLGGYHIGLVQKIDDSAVSLSFLVDELDTVRRLYIWRLPQGSFLVDRLSVVGKRLAESVPVDKWVDTQMDDWIASVQDRAHSEKDGTTTITGQKSLGASKKRSSNA